MSNEDTPQAQLIQRMTISDFPPMLDTIRDGRVLWRELRAIEYGMLGYFLCCHLVIEYYLLEALKRTGRPTEKLNWDTAKLTFNQKVNLFPLDDEPRKRLIPCLKHLNKLRNHFSHNLGFQLTGEDLAPFVAYLKWALITNPPLPTEHIKIVELFTTAACSYFAGYITNQEMANKKRGK
jgi:hypothetical protein